MRVSKTISQHMDWNQLCLKDDQTLNGVKKYDNKVCFSEYITGRHKHNTILIKAKDMIFQLTEETTLGMKRRFGVAYQKSFIIIIML